VRQSAKGCVNASVCLLIDSHRIVWSARAEVLRLKPRTEISNSRVRTNIAMIPEPEQAAGGTREAVEDIDYPARRELDRAQIRQLANCRWVQEHHNILITGATGTAKTFVACALAHKACRSGHRALYRRASRLFDELTLARADGTYARVLQRVARIDVLIIDDWALAAVHEQERQDLLEILEDRHGTRSTIVTSQLPVAKWHAHIGDPTLADAICDRLLHNAHRLVLKGPSRRKEAQAE